MGIPLFADAATLYLREGGTAATAGAAIGPCSTLANTMTVATNNTGTGMNVGDDVKVCSNETIDISGASIEPPVSGVSAANPTAYTADSGTPVIDGGGTSNIYGFIITDKDYITIDGLTIQNIDDAHIKVVSTANRTGFIFTNNTLTDSKYNSIWFDTTAGFTASNLTLTGNTILRWSQSTTGAGDGASGVDDAIYFEYVDTATVNVNHLDMISCTRTVSSRCGSAMRFSTTNYVGIEGNYMRTKKYSNTDGMPGGGHGINFDCHDGILGCDTIGNFAQYNKAVDMGDDCYSSKVRGFPEFNANLCIGVHDDGAEVISKSPNNTEVNAIYRNNTFISYTSRCLEVEAHADSAVIWENNFCVQDDTLVAELQPGTYANYSPTGRGRPLASNSTFTTNIYYDTTGTPTTPFRSCGLDAANDCPGTCAGNECCAGGAGNEPQCATFIEWQADSFFPDIGSSTNQPFVDLTTGVPIGFTNILRDKGTDMCTNFTELLHKDAVWIVGIAPKLQSVCPITQYDKWDIGAYRIHRGMP